MKFAKSLAQEAVPEWRAKYLDYRGLKKKITLIQHEQIIAAGGTIPASAVVSRSNSPDGSAPILSPPMATRGRLGAPDESLALLAEVDPATTTDDDRGMTPVADDAARAAPSLHQSLHAHFAHDEKAGPAHAHVPFPTTAGTTASSAAASSVASLDSSPTTPARGRGGAAKYALANAGGEDTLQVLGSLGSDMDQGLILDMHLDDVADATAHAKSRDRSRSVVRKSSFRSTISAYRQRHRAGTVMAGVDEPVVIGAFDEFLETRGRAEKEFFKMLDAELHKIDTFYNEQRQVQLDTISKIKQQIAMQRQERNSLEAALVTEPVVLRFLHAAPVSPSTMIRKKVLRDAMLEFYRGLLLLRNYQILNFTGLIKILKKFSKTAHWQAARPYMTDRKPLLKWDQDRTVRDLLKETENLYCEFFANGRRQVGMKQLRLPDKRKVTYQEVTWTSGFFLGAGLCLLIQCIVVIIKGETYNAPHFIPMVQVYSGLLMPIVFAMLFVGCLSMWSIHGVNYAFIFEFDSRDHIHYLEFLSLPSLLFFAWSLFVFLTLSPYNADLGMSPLVLPVVFSAVIVALFANPLPVMYRGARYWLIRTLTRIVLSPFHKIYFRDFFLTDILCSLTFSLTSLPLFFCVSFRQQETCDTSTSLFTLAFALVPLVLRLLQCLRRTYDSGHLHPHMTNAVKYALSSAVVVASFHWRATQLNAWFYLWIGISCAATLYAIAWDTVFDWGLLQRGARGLRHDKIFPEWWYYAALVLNVILRASWIMLVSPGHWLPTLPVFTLTMVSALLEVVRRVVWCLFRMENEHVSNCGQFRATKEIPLPRAPHAHDDDDVHGHGATGGGATGGGANAHV
ncbi:Xenotropic and polytropic retrovirus receptor 1 [Allomyces arbusculus]|nr:Xenotropic and polytropic retrovirus receptor 1 [Allomyces arbusculus]